MKKGYVSEIYPTIQGEGPWTGQKQLFVRLAGCPLRCDYCDTPDSLTVNGHDKMTADDVLKKILFISQQEKIKTVSITGGEPLVQSEFLKELFKKLKEQKFDIHLETAGIHFKPLENVIDFCDVIAMDIKLPSATGKTTWSEHQSFLGVAKNKAFVKIVVETHSPFEEIKKAISILEKIKPTPLLIIQPVTPVSSGTTPPKKEIIDDILEYARGKLPEVRLMPQQQKLWGFR